MVLAVLVKVTTPVKLFEPVKVWLVLSRATLVERRAFGMVPEARFAALRLVSALPSPLNADAVTVPEKAGLPFNNATLGESWLSATVPLN